MSRSGSAAARRRPVEGHVALVLHLEDERARQPEPLWTDGAHQRLAVPVEGRGEAHREAPVDGNGVHAVMARDPARVGMPDVGDRPAVGREGRPGDRSLGPCQLARLAALNGHREDVGREILVARRVTSGDEGHPPTVRRPRRVVIVKDADGELLRRLAVRGDHEDLLRPVVDEAHAVRLVLEDVDDPRRLGALALLLVRGFLPPTDPGHEREPPAVGGPGGARHARPEVGQPHRLAPVRRHHVELALALRLPLGHEGELPPVRRPAWCRVTPRPPGERPGAGAIHVDDPDRGEVLVSRLGERRDDESDATPIRVELGIADEPDPEEVLRDHGAARRLGHRRSVGAARAGYEAADGSLPSAAPPAASAAPPAASAAPPAASAAAPARSTAEPALSATRRA